jgi:octaprenyl-diphosphate synthase
LATVNSRWDTEASILLGDFLFTHAFYLASTLDSSYACQRLGRATNLVCEGELRQKGTRGDFDLDEATYLSIIEAKTAELCAGSSALGAYFAGAVPAVVTKFDGYGRCLGIAFQIADDVLDIVGDERVVGKSLGTDLDSQKPTLPLIRLLSVVGGAQRERLIATLEGEPESRREVLLPYFQRYGAVEYAREVAIRYAEKARRYLEGLEPNPAVDALHQVAEYAVTRPA